MAHWAGGIPLADYFRHMSSHPEVAYIDIICELQFWHRTVEELLLFVAGLSRFIILEDSKFIVLCDSKFIVL